MQFVINDAVGVEAVFGVGVGADGLVKAVVFVVDDAFLRVDDAAVSGQGRGSAYHGGRGVEDEGGLVAFGRGGIDLRAGFAVAEEHVQGDGRGQLGLAVLAGDFDVAGAVLPQAVPIDAAEEFAQEIFLPCLEEEWAAGPFAFGVLEGADELDGAACVVFVHHWMSSSRPSPSFFSLGRERRDRLLGVMPNSVQNALICFMQA